MGSKGLVSVILEGLGLFFGGGHCDRARELVTQDFTLTLGNYNAIAVSEGGQRSESQRESECDVRVNRGRSQ